jgi:dTDP-4-amino-4,6-dideoxygalactose transaminase
VTEGEDLMSSGTIPLHVVRVADHERLQKDVTTADIGTGIHYYPGPLHFPKALEALGFGPGDFLVAEQVACPVPSLPLFPGLLAKQEARVAVCVVEFTRATGQRVDVQGHPRGGRR